MVSVKRHAPVAYLSEAMCLLRVMAALYYPSKIKLPLSALITEDMASDRSYIFVIIGAMLSVSAIVISIVCVVIAQKRKSARKKRAASRVQSREVGAASIEPREVPAGLDPLQRAG